MAKKYKCPYCNERYIRKDLIDHIDKEHEELIPDNSDSAQVVYDLVNGTKGAGRCRVCGSPTKWNSKAGRYDVLCGKPSCKQKMREEYQKNMLKVHGTYNILNDEEQQKKMLANRSISGTYKFTTDGGFATYTGSYEKKFLEFADKVMQIPSKDIMAPGPTLEYEMNGEKHFYITDFLYIPYNLIIEVKDGGSNPNNKSSEGMRSSRQRTIEKEKLITDRGEFNYLRLTDNQFVQLLEIFMEIKKALLEGDDKKVVRINESQLLEAKVMKNCKYDKCPVCGSDEIGVYLNGEPVYKCKRCGEYLGMVPFGSKKESTNIFTSGDFDKYRGYGERRLQEIYDEETFSEARAIDNKSDIDRVTNVFKHKSSKPKKKSYDVLTNFGAYHLEPTLKPRKQIHGGWDEELYSKDIESAINNDIKDNYKLKNVDKVSAYVYTAGKNLKSVYLGRITIFDKNTGDWEWEEQEFLDKKVYDYLMNYPITESTDISNFYEEGDYE